MSDNSRYSREYDRFLDDPDAPECQALRQELRQYLEGDPRGARWLAEAQSNERQKSMIRKERPTIRTFNLAGAFALVVIGMYLGRYALRPSGQPGSFPSAAPVVSSPESTPLQFNPAGNRPNPVIAANAPNHTALQVDRARSDAGNGSSASRQSRTERPPESAPSQASESQ